MDDDLEGDIGLAGFSGTAPLPKTRPRPTVLPRLSSTSPTNGMRSPSSPSVATRDLPQVSRRQLSRSSTLPRMPSQRGARPRLVMEGFTMDEERMTKLRRWILSLIIVEFDLEVGPQIADMFPPLHLSRSESLNIAFSSFPDSALFEEGSEVHSFRFRTSEPTEKGAAEPDPPRPCTVDGFMYGFSCFTQKKSTTSKRGYQQRSLVILTHLAYPSLFYTLLSKLGSAFEEHGGPMLEAAYHGIASWPDPRPGTNVELGFLGTVLHAEIPQAADAQQSMCALQPSHSDTDLQILVTLCPPDPPVLQFFEAVISHLWSIWECVVLGEPLLVFGTSPGMTSIVIWWLRDILRPIPFAGDFRPFFTIHDADHAALVNSRPPKGGLLLGVTNPIFDRGCKHWPHVVSLGKHHPEKKAHKEIIAGPLPGWKSTHKRYISKDHALLKQLEVAVGKPRHTQQQASAALHKHFSSRTTAFLVPLQRYLQTLIPTPTESSQTLGSSRLKSFSDSAFFASLKAHGSPLPFKSAGKQKEFYQRWLRTPAFGLWLANQDEAVRTVLRGLQ